MRAHVAQVTARREGGPLLCRRVLQAIVAVVRVVQTADRLPVLFDQSGGIELGINHDGIRGGMAEQCLDDMHGRIVVQMFGGKHSPAVVWQQYERGAIRAPGFGKYGEFTNTAANRLYAGSAGMPDALEEVRRLWSGALLHRIPMITDRNIGAVIEALHMADDLGQDPAETVPNRDDTSAVVLRRLNVQQVI